MIPKNVLESVQESLQFGNTPGKFIDLSICFNACDSNNTSAPVKALLQLRFESLLTCLNFLQL
jgi:hypothetical protein